MKMLTLLAAVLLGPCAAVAPAFAQSAGDRTIVGGERVGAVKATSTAAQLRRLYGAANVRAGAFRTGEGTFNGIILFPGKPDAIRLYYSDDKKRIATVEIGAQRNAWHTPEGVRVGTKLAEIERINGRPFRLQRHEGEGGGFVVVHQPGLKLPDVTLQLLATGRQSNADVKALGAKSSLSSDDPLLRKAALEVYKIFVRLGRP